MNHESTHRVESTTDEHTSGGCKEVKMQEKGPPILKEEGKRRKRPVDSDVPHAREGRKEGNMVANGPKTKKVTEGIWQVRLRRNEE